MGSLFDSPQFNERLFFPRSDTSPCPSGAKDSMLTVSTRPRVRLHARTWGHREATASLLLFHGNGEVVADYDDVVPDFLALGLEVTVIDYRGYGKSEGTPTLRTMLSDAVAVVEALPVPKKRLVFGRSLGAACAAELVSKGVPMAGLVLESGGSDLAGLVARRGYPAPTFTEEELAVFEPKAKLAKCTVPTLVLHGAEDHLIVPAEAQGAFDALGTSQKKLVFIEGRGHNDVSFSDAYWDALKRWVGSLPLT